MPGYARGLTFLGNHAIVGLSLPRRNRTFQDLPLDQALTRRDADPQCGIALIDLDSGEMKHIIAIDG